MNAHAQNQNTNLLPEAHRGPAERLLDVVLRSGAHLWHNRPGIEKNGTWIPAKGQKQNKLKALIQTAIKPGLHVPAAVELYKRLLEIYQLNAELFAHFASYALVETDWRDLKVAAAALMLVQKRAGEAVKNKDGQVEFYDDDFRAVGEAIILFYEKGSTKMLTPKGVLRIAELLETKEIAALNKRAGFGDPASKKAPLGRWKSAATQWLAIREKNVQLLQGLVKAGFKETIKKIARKAGYRPESQAFFEILGWKQKQNAAGHRTIGLADLSIKKADRFDGLTEEQICERIVREKLGYKETVGRLPKDVGLTPAIMAALLPSLSDRDLRMMTPTLESLGMFEDASIKARWERAIATATDQRALNVVKNVRNTALKEKLAEAADNAVKAAVSEATKDADLEVMFLIDKSGSMEGAIEKSKEALSRILAGFPLNRLHLATFDTVGTVLRPKAATRTAVQHLLANVKAAGGTSYGAGAAALHRDGLRIKGAAKLILIAAGDEDGEAGTAFAKVLTELGLVPAAVAMIIAVKDGQRRGRTVRDAAAHLKVPFTDIDASAFDDPYQVPRALKALLDAPVLAGGVAVVPSVWVEKVMNTPILKKPLAA
jgi:hypothetical protein